MVTETSTSHRGVILLSLDGVLILNEKKAISAAHKGKTKGLSTFRRFQ
jgi:hypothetical protein